MNLAKELSELENVWDALIRLAAKVDQIADEQEWPELSEMVVDQMFNPPESDPSEIMFAQEQFLMRLCLRLKTHKKSDFNIVSEVNYLDKDCFRIANYDYKTFMWARSLNLDTIENNLIYIPMDKLSDKQIEALKKKAYR